MRKKTIEDYVELIDIFHRKNRKVHTSEIAVALNINPASVTEIFQKLSKEGFITLVFDPRGFGDSGGHPLLLDSLRQVDDAKNSIDFISTLEQVDKNNVFNMGM